MSAGFRICLGALKIGIIMLILWFIDPLGVATNADRASAALFYRVVAPEYPPLSEDKTESAVIVINDNSLAHLSIPTGTDEAEVIPTGNETAGITATWPPSMIVHKTIIERIFRFASPKAVFIDFGFFDDRDSGATNAFASTLKRLAVPKDKLDEFRACQNKQEQTSESEDPACETWIGKAPIFLPSVEAEVPVHLKVLPQLADVATALVSTKYIGEEFDTYNQYDLYGCIVGSSPEKPTVTAPSAALAMFSASSSVSRYRTADCPAKKLPERLSIYWSDWGDTEHSHGAYPCRTLPDSVIGRLWSILQNWFLAIIGVSAPSQFQICPPFLTFSAHDFLSDGTGEMEEYLDDRYVFYGGNFVMADDLIRPPTHDPVPGVYVHAMVLDNLLQGETKHTESRYWGLRGAITFLAIVIVAFCSAWTWRPESFRCKQGGLVRKVGKSVWVVARGIGVCLLSTLVLAWIAFFHFDLAPINYVGVLLFAALYFMGQMVEKPIEKFFARVFPNKDQLS